MSLLTAGASDICSAGSVTSGAVGLPVAMSKCCWGMLRGRRGACISSVGLLARSPELVSELKELCWLLMSLGAAVQTEGVAHA